VKIRYDREAQHDRHAEPAEFDNSEKGSKPDGFAQA
jgi:hypothetical protein